MSYRIRNNDITKYSPFELMFGKQMNTFQDYEKKDILNEELSLTEDGYIIIDTFSKKTGKAKEVRILYYKGPLTRSKAKKMALYSKWNWLIK
jgi:hypothetical protein